MVVVRGSRRWFVGDWYTWAFGEWIRNWLRSSLSDRRARRLGEEEREMMGERLKVLLAAAIGLLSIGGNMQSALGQAATTGVNTLPSAPTVKLTEPLYLRDTGKDYTHLKPMFPTLIAPYNADQL